MNKSNKVKVLRGRDNFRAVRREATGHLGEEHLGRGAGAKALGQEYSWACVVTTGE